MSNEMPIYKTMNSQAFVLGYSWESPTFNVAINHALVCQFIIAKKIPNVIPALATASQQGQKLPEVDPNF